MVILDYFIGILNLTLDMDSKNKCIMDNITGKIRYTINHYGVRFFTHEWGHWHLGLAGVT